MLDETEADYLAADPTVGGDVKALNTASMADTQCLETCTWTRTVEATETGAGTWTAAGAAVTDGIEVTVTPATFTLAAGETPGDHRHGRRRREPTEAYQFGTVVLTPAAGSEASAAHLPVAALPSTGVFPDEIDIDTRRDAGSQESDPIEAVEITDLDVQAKVWFRRRCRALHPGGLDQHRPVRRQRHRGRQRGRPRGCHTSWRPSQRDRSDFDLLSGRARSARPTSSPAVPLAAPRRGRRRVWRR